MQNTLRSLLAEFKADRVVVALVHSVDNKRLDFYDYVFSIKYESCNNINSIQHLVQNKPISILLNEDEHYVQDTLFASSELKTLPILCTNYLSRIQVTTVINHYLFYEDLIIGLFSFQYKDLKSCPYKSQSECLKDIGKINLAATKITNNLINLLD